MLILLGCQVVANRLPQVSKGKYSIGQYSVVEGSENGYQEEGDNNGNEENVENSVDNSPFEYVGGKIGKGVVLLTQSQQECLLEKLGLDAFNHYVEKLATFIIDKQAKVSNHYSTILKWAKEDAAV